MLAHTACNYSERDYHNSYYGGYICSIDQFRHSRSLRRSASPASLAEGLARGEWQACLRLPWSWQRFRCDDAHCARTRRECSPRLYQAEQTDVPAVRGVGEEECKIVESSCDRQAQRSRARL